MRQRPALARCVVRDLGNTGHTTEIAGTTRECRTAILGMEETVLADLFRPLFLLRQ